MLPRLSVEDIDRLLDERVEGQPVGCPTRWWATVEIADQKF
jgi:hypothetical protein